MCFFPIPNTKFNSPAYKAGVYEFDCGACPECLAKRSSVYCLKAYYEAQEHDSSCSVCLTYDSYLRDGRGRIIGERLRNDLCVNRRDIQLFIKRLRKKFGTGIKVFYSAEYGKRTHRPHYHACFFGVSFDDAVPYKKSKRGNIIYTSETLTKLWKNGICTIDSKRVTPAVARYCTKYAMKDKNVDTFSGCSKHLGLAGLLRDFNGKSYTIDGREYPIPRQVWERKICEWYAGTFPAFTPKYLSKRDYPFEIALRNEIERRNYRELRNQDIDYINYLKYWKDRAEIYEDIKPDTLTRINRLNEEKYHDYKVQARVCLTKRRLGIPAVAPRARAGLARYRKWQEETFGFYFDFERAASCRCCSRHATADDTTREQKVEKALSLARHVALTASSMEDCPIDWIASEKKFE